MMGRRGDGQSDQLLPRHLSRHDRRWKSRAFWERNLRLKTDSSKVGPQNGAPALVSAGMMGDRADVIFAAPEEISKMIAPQC